MKSRSRLGLRLSLNKLSRVGVGGWVDQLRLKLTQSPTRVGVEVGTELGKSKDEVLITPTELMNLR